MIFQSVEYALLLGLTWLLAWGVLRERPAPRRALLLAASYGFYAAWDWRFSLLLVFSTVLDYLVGRALHRETAERRRRWLLLVSLAGNLAVLGIFKYWDFGLRNLNVVLDLLGLPTSGAFLEILPPLGISFFTFQSMSYSLDIYRRKLEPAKGLLDFALFVAFFPQLVAGPVVRAREFLPQLVDRPTYREEEMLAGIYRIARGLVKKVVIADTVGAVLVDPVYADPGAASATAVVLAVYGFGVQVLFDFEGYTDIAIGSARLLGFRLPENFDDPYRAISITEFWRRWHMTMTRFFRDYLYLPIARTARRVAEPLRHVALFLTMVLIGLWHGAAWTYLCFGAVHGAIMVVEALVRRRRSAARGRSRFPRPVAVALNCHLLIVTMVAFRAESLPDLAVLGGRLVDGDWASPAALPVDALLFLVVGWALALSGKRLRGLLHARFLSSPLPLQAGAYAVMVALVALYIRAKSPYIYFIF